MKQIKNRLIEIQENSKSKQPIVELEAALTQSAFGHEYALMDLQTEVPFLHREQLIEQLEEHKKIYFWAREQLRLLDPKKLNAIEEEIKQQKETILREASFVRPKSSQEFDVSDHTVH